MLARGYQANSIAPFEPVRSLTESEQLVIRFENHGLQKLNINEMIDYGLACYEKYMVENCGHISEKFTKESLVYI